MMQTARQHLVLPAIPGTDVAHTKRNQIKSYVLHGPPVFPMYLIPGSWYQVGYVVNPERQTMLCSTYGHSAGAAFQVLPTPFPVLTYRSPIPYTTSVPLTHAVLTYSADAMPGAVPS